MLWFKVSKVVLRSSKITRVPNLSRDVRRLKMHTYGAVWSRNGRMNKCLDKSWRRKEDSGVEQGVTNTRRRYGYITIM